MKRFINALISGAGAALGIMGVNAIATNLKDPGKRAKIKGFFSNLKDMLFGKKES